ncbi:hypothetical protein FQR65_LT01235 [Abscondita terminalis]|nr:hypothetical protein FQR65_LT01235 [Abscondita terminalis]
MEEHQTDQNILPGYSTIDDYIKKGFQVVLEATKASNALPAQREWDFYKTYDSFNKILVGESDKILRLMNKVLHDQDQNVNIRNRDMDERMEMLIEANDNILEKVAVGIDELNGIKKATHDAIEIQAVSAQLPVNGSWNQLNKAKFSVSSSIVNHNNSSNSIRLLTAKNIIRPQTYFKDKIDNSNNPWIPRITEKPNSIKPYSHPYETELEYFKPSASLLKKVTPAVVTKLEETPLIEISTEEDLDCLLNELRKCTEFAVDLEHHSYRTFMGIACLMQISTHNADYLIDTFTLRDKLCILNEVFTKPSIVKIFHGADHDIQWLQRDLSIYVVNMFDTHQAAKQLSYPALSLAYLLKHFCNVEPNKHFQLADWRIRPLPTELKTYARMDTHYLIHIYHKLRNELLKKGNGSDNILKTVINQSTEICKKVIDLRIKLVLKFCLQRYVKPLLREDSYMEFYQKSKRLFDNRQLFALKELYKWRDDLGRTEDESTGYILPNHMLLQISEQLPREMQGILACCNPIPPLVRANLLELHRIILKAREQPSVKPILKEDNRSRGSTFQLSKLNMDSPLHCPHDLSKSCDFRDDLPTLLGNLENNSLEDDEANQNLSVENTKSSIRFLMRLVFLKKKRCHNAMFKIKRMAFLAPYERYELIKPYIQEEEKEEKATEDQTKELSNDDRIAALHEHFVKVSKETPQKLVDEIKNATAVKEEDVEVVSPHATLKSMWRSKKRKRVESNDNDCCIVEESPGNIDATNELHTPKPNFKRGQKNKFKKNKKKGKNNQQHNTSTQSLELNDSEPGASGFNNNKQGFKQKSKQKFEGGNNFKPFDYSSVNFQHYQGGAGRSNNKKGFFRTEFKAKNKKKKNNKNSNNRSMTYNRQN